MPGGATMTTMRLVEEVSKYWSHVFALIFHHRPSLQHAPRGELNLQDALFLPFFSFCLLVWKNIEPADKKRVCTVLHGKNQQPTKVANASFTELRWDFISSRLSLFQMSSWQKHNKENHMQSLHHQRKGKGKEQCPHFENIGVGSHTWNVNCRALFRVAQPMLSTYPEAEFSKSCCKKVWKVNRLNLIMTVSPEVVFCDNKLGHNLAIVGCTFHIPCNCPHPNYCPEWKPFQLLITHNLWPFDGEIANMSVTSPFTNTCVALCLFRLRFVDFFHKAIEIV